MFDVNLFEEKLAAIDVEKFWRDGWLIVPDVYSDEEVEQMRAEALEHVKEGGEIATSPLKHVLTDGRMTAVARKLLGTDEVLYGGDSSATNNGKIRAWHKDNTDRLDANAPDWDDRYTQLRFGIYLQDHTQHTGGLNLKTGAHDICDLTSGPTIYVKNNPGDMLVWSMRMTHSGAGTLLKDPSARFPEPEEFNKFPPEEICPEHENRIAVFVHLGANDKHGRRYLDYLRTRTYMVNGWRKRPWSPELVKELEESGLTVRDMPKEVLNDPRAGLNKLWAPYPYQDKQGKFQAVSQESAPKPAPKPSPEASKSAPSTPATPSPKDAAPKPAAPKPSTPQSGAATRKAPASAKARYAAAVRRRTRGIFAGAIEGWHDGGPTAERKARELYRAELRRLRS